MVDWKTFKIVNISKHDVMYWKPALFFTLDGEVRFRDGDFQWIKICNHPSATTWQVGDTVEIDLDKTKHYGKMEHWGEGIDDCDIIRKVSSAVVPSSSSNQQISSNQIQERDERMRRWVEESGGEYEADFTARQEYREDGRISAHEMKWTYKKK